MNLSKKLLFMALASCAALQQWRKTLRWAPAKPTDTGWWQDLFDDSSCVRTVGTLR